MFFPIGDTNIRSNKKPMITYFLIVINVIIFFYQITLPQIQQQNFIYQWGCIPAEIQYGRNLITLFSGMFLHGGWLHIIGNMMFLWIFGDNIEIVIGSRKFLLFYLIGGVIAMLIHAVFNWNSEIPCVGASGAIAACMGTYLVIFPKSKIKIFFLLFFTTFRVSAIMFLGVWIIQQLVNSFEVMGVVTDGVAYWAHVGGFVYGTLIGVVIRMKYDLSKFIIE